LPFRETPSEAESASPNPKQFDAVSLVDQLIVRTSGYVENTLHDTFEKELITSIMRSAGGESLDCPELPGTIESLEPSWSKQIAQTCNETQSPDSAIQPSEFNASCAATWSIFARTAPAITIDIPRKLQLTTDKTLLDVHTLFNVHDLLLQIKAYAKANPPSSPQHSQSTEQQAAALCLYRSFVAAALVIIYHAATKLLEPEIAIAAGAADVAAARSMFTHRKLKLEEAHELLVPQVKVRQMNERIVSKTSGFAAAPITPCEYVRIELGFVRIQPTNLHLFMPLHVMALLDLALAFSENLPLLRMGNGSCTERTWCSPATVWSPPQGPSLSDSSTRELLASFHSRISRLRQAQSGEKVHLVQFPFRSRIYNWVNELVRYVLLPSTISPLRSDKALVVQLTEATFRCLATVLDPQTEEDSAFKDYLSHRPALEDRRYEATWLEEGRAIVVNLTVQESSELSQLSRGHITPLSSMNQLLQGGTVAAVPGHALRMEAALNEAAMLATRASVAMNTPGAISEAVQDLVRLMHKLTLDACLAADLQLQLSSPGTIPSAREPVQSLRMLINLVTLFVALSPQQLNQVGGFRIPAVAAMAHCDALFLRTHLNAMFNQLLLRLSLARLRLSPQLQTELYNMQTSMNERLTLCNEKLWEASTTALLPALNEGWSTLSRILSLSQERMISVYEFLKTRNQALLRASGTHLTNWFSPVVVRFLSTDEGESLFPPSPRSRSGALTLLADLGKDGSVGAGLPLSFNAIERDVQDALAAVSQYLQVLKDLVASWMVAPLASSIILREVILKAANCIAEAIVSRALNRSELSLSASEAISSLLKRLLRDGLELEKLLGRFSDRLVDLDQVDEDILLHMLNPEVDVALSLERVSSPRNQSGTSQSTEQTSFPQLDRAIEASILAATPFEADVAPLLRSRLVANGEESKITGSILRKSRSWLRARGLFEMLRESHTLMSLQAVFNEGELGRLFTLDETKRFILAVYEPSEKRTACLEFVDALYNGPF